MFDNYDKVQSKVERFAQQGCRVLALGHTTLKVKENDIPKTIKPLALIVIQDHIRDDAADTIAYFKHNGVDVKVISGDNPITVSEIALRAGVENAERFISLAGLTDDQVRESVFEYTVFGRVSPVQKRIIIQTLKKHKKVVAMTGDGVNDILALKEADCSIAMASGSEATRYVSHLVLMDSNFSSMPKVVDE
ncbi:MAG TPA: HAD-IC family P-type ATPase, partial [Bacilli bacterium]|nr:HAD-IC family P-type ATPase [Bacilli bacterium]